MSGTPAEKRRGHTWDDYRGWQDDKRWEIIGGQAFDMTPAPTVLHQAISRELGLRLMSCFAGKKCQMFHAPIDVKLSDEDVVQPDLIVVCDRKQILETHIEGPPALIVEILSPSSLRHDRVRKLELYARAGVKEFWLVTPEPPLVEVLVLEGASYRLHAGYGPDEALRSPNFPRLKLALAGVFVFPGLPGTKGKMARETTLRYGARRRGPARYRLP